MGRTKFASIRLPPGLKEKLKKQAEKNRRSLASEIIITLERGLERCLVEMEKV